jgi:hypothetical protein
LNCNWINGWADLSFPFAPGDATGGPVHALPATGPTTFLTAATAGGSSVSTGNTVTYFGLPVIGFAAQTYSTTGLPGVSPNVLSNYGGNFNHKYMRNIVTNNPAPVGVAN